MPKNNANSEASAATGPVLVVDDDRKIVALVRAYLEREGYSVVTAYDGRTAVEKDRSERPVLIVLDLMLPELDGFEAMRLIRADSAVPILMLTARSSLPERILGLEKGADDYLPKPFNPRELVARLRAVLRRRGGPGPRAGVTRFGRLEIDRDAREVRIEGEVRSLTSHQFALLCALSDRPGRVLSRDDLMQAVRGSNLEAFDRSIDVHVSRIRAAIEDDPKRPRRVITVRGAGYVFARHQDDGQD